MNERLSIGAYNDELEEVGFLGRQRSAHCCSQIEMKKERVPGLRRFVSLMGYVKKRDHDWRLSAATLLLRTRRKAVMGKKAWKLKGKTSIAFYIEVKDLRYYRICNSNLVGNLMIRLPMVFNFLFSNYYEFTKLLFPEKNW